MENISGFFVVFKEVEQWQITINIARRERYKFFSTKMYSKERAVIKTTLKTFNLCSSYYGRSRYFFNGHRLPARANGTKREAVWYSELYLPFFGRYANYPKRQGLPQKNEVFLREEEPQRRIPSTAKAVDEKQSLRRQSELYLLGKDSKKESTEVMNYVVFSMPHGKI